MKDLFPLIINLPTEYVSMHKREIEDFFSIFDEKIAKEYRYIVKTTRERLKFKFNRYGSLLIPLSKLDKEELDRIQLIENSYFGCPFFKKIKNNLTSRGAVYYISGLIEDPYIKKIRLISNLEISLDILNIFLSNDVNIDSYSSVSLLDDIRYKTIIIYEYLLSHNDTILSLKFRKLVKIFSVNFYKIINKDFDRKNLEIEGEIRNGVKLYKTLLSEFASEYDSQKVDTNLKTYKEVDNPEHVWMFINKLKGKVPSNIDLILGIRFGGIELPFLVNNLILPDTKVALVKISTYTEDSISVSLEQNLVGSKNVLVLDDNILTGRTLQKLVDKIKILKPKNIYFSCFSYSGMKRYSQMIMKNHGLINPNVLERTCLVTQSHYTKISNTKSYKNKRGVFDKAKKEIQDTLDSYNSFLFKI